MKTTKNERHQGRCDLMDYAAERFEYDKSELFEMRDRRRAFGLNNWGILTFSALMWVVVGYTAFVLVWTSAAMVTAERCGVSSTVCSHIARTGRPS